MSGAAADADPRYHWLRSVSGRRQERYVRSQPRPCRQPQTSQQCPSLDLPQFLAVLSLAGHEPVFVVGKQTVQHGALPRLAESLHAGLQGRRPV